MANDFFDPPLDTGDGQKFFDQRYPVLMSLGELFKMMSDTTATDIAVVQVHNNGAGMRGDGNQFVMELKIALVPLAMVEKYIADSHLDSEQFQIHKSFAAYRNCVQHAE